LEDDVGSPWETLTQPILGKWLDEVGPVTVRLKKHKWGMTADINGRLESLSHGWNYDPQGFKTCIWRETITLRWGAPAIDIELEVDWEAENGRLQVEFESAFQATEGETYFDIPFGSIKRKPYTPVFGRHTNPNGDWPAYNGICQENSSGHYSVSVLTRGLPAFRVQGNTIFSSPLRSPTFPLYAFDIDGAKDTGKHTFQYRLTSHAGGFAQSELAQEGMAFNACYPVKQVITRNAGGKRSSEHSFGSLDSPTAVISALKQAESGDGLIVRAYETSGTACHGALYIEGYEVNQVLNLLEEPMPGDTDSYERFEIKTLELTSLSGKKGLQN
jgi:alpha-mannosidase